MKNALLAVSVAALVGAVSAGVVTLWLAPHAPRGEARPSERTPFAPEAGDGELRRELARLELENQALAARIEALELRPVLSARDALEPTPLAGGEESLAATGDDTRSMLLASELPESVRAALEDIRAEEEAEGRRLSEEREALRREERLERWREAYGLSNVQVNDLRTWDIDGRAAREELQRQRDAGGDRGVYRAARAALRENETLALRGILTPAQFLAWEKEGEQRDEDRSARRREEPRDG